MSTGDKHEPGFIPPYDDAQHAEVLEDLIVGEHGYKYRLLDGIVMPPYITPSRYQVSRTIETRPGDICFTSYPKSGSTWLSYVLLLLTTDGDLPSDQTLRSSVHWVASSWTYPRSREELDALPSPRIFKSHMPYGMAVGGNPAEKECKYIYIARNPKDVVVSYYHFESGKNWSGGYEGPWEHWLEMFLTGRVQRGDWFDHVLSWWAHADAPNVLFLKYEDMKHDFPRELDRIAKFLGTPMTGARRTEIIEKTTFDRMRKTEFSNMHEIRGIGNFFRKGKSGSWKEQFTSAQTQEFDRVYVRRMDGSGLTFDFE